MGASEGLITLAGSTPALAVGATADAPVLPRPKTAPPKLRRMPVPRLWPTWFTAAVQLSILVGAVVAWEVAAHYKWLDPFFWSRPTAIYDTMLKFFGAGNAWDPTCAREPSSCASGFGVLAMGGAMREWTDSDSALGDRDDHRRAVVRGAAASAGVSERLPIEAPITQTSAHGAEPIPSFSECRPTSAPSLRAGNSNTAA